MYIGVLITLKKISVVVIGRLGIDPENPFRDHQWAA